MGSLQDSVKRGKENFLRQKKVTTDFPMRQRILRTCCQNFYLVLRDPFVK